MQKLTIENETSPFFYDLKNVELIRYDTLEEVDASLYGLKIIENKDTYIIATDDNQNEVIIPIDNAYDNQKSNIGIWGYSNPDTETIHYWVDNKISTFSTVVQFLAHELWHIYKNKISNDDEFIQQEEEGDLVGNIANKSYSLATYILYGD